MAQSYTRWKWWIQMSLKNDIYIIFSVLILFGIIGYLLVIYHDAPDVTYMDLSARRQRQIIEELKAETPPKYQHNLKTAIQDQLNSDKDVDFEDRLLDDRKEDEYGDFEHRMFNDRILQISPEIEKQAIKDANEHKSKNLSLKKTPLKDTNKAKVPIHSDNWLKRNKDRLNIALNPKTNGFNIEAPVDSSLHGGKAHCTVYNPESVINERFECLPLQVNLTNKPKVCLYPSDIDIHLSRKIREDGVWEPHILKLLLDILKKDPSYGFIDIGANIGVYTLVAAASGHKVVAVEPFEENLKHLTKGIELTAVSDQVIVLQNAISDERLDYVDLVTDDSNQGGIRVDKGNHDYECLGDVCPPQVKTILMDDLLEVINFKKAIIKIDIEGHEHHAFREAKKLMKQVFISHIIMEWLKMKEHYRTLEEVTKDKLLVSELLNFLGEEGFKAYSMVTGQEQDPEHWYAWPDDVIWKHELLDMLEKN